MFEIECSGKTKGMRRISLAGQRVLYEVAEAAQAILVLAMVLWLVSAKTPAY